MAQKNKMNQALATQEKLVTVFSLIIYLTTRKIHTISRLMLRPHEFLSQSCILPEKSCGLSSLVCRSHQVLNVIITVCVCNKVKTPLPWNHEYATRPKPRELSLNWQTRTEFQDAPNITSTNPLLLNPCSLHFTLICTSSTCERRDKCQAMKHLLCGRHRN